MTPCKAAHSITVRWGFRRTWGGATYRMHFHRCTDHAGRRTTETQEP